MYFFGVDAANSDSETSNALLYALCFLQKQQYFVCMHISRENSSMFPKQWTIFQINQPATHKIFQILHRCRALRSSLVKIKEYSSQRLEMYDYIEQIISNNKESVNIQLKETVINDIRDETVQHLKEFWEYQRHVLESFLAITYQEFQRNMQDIKNINATSDKIKEQYILYVKEQFISASEVFERFVEEELKLGLQYHLASNQQLNDNESHWSIISKTLGSDLKAFFRDVKVERQKLGSSQTSHLVPCIILIVVLFINLVLLGLSLASFQIYGDNSKIKELAYMWQGSGVYLLYLWIDYGLSEYCFARRINVLLGMGCNSFHSIIFYQQRWKPVILLALTNTYVFLFTLFLKWQQNLYLGVTINILLIAYQLFQILFGHIRIGMTQTMYFKLSCLHFNLILIPLSDIIASILVFFSSSLHKNIVFVGIIYMAIVPIFYVRLLKNAKKEQSLLYEKSYLFLIPLAVQIAALFLKDLLGLAIVDLLIKVFTTIFLMSYDYSLFAKEFLFQECRKTCIDIFSCPLYERPQQFQKRMQVENSYPRIIKLFLIISSISFPFILPFGMYIQSITGITKYAYQAFIMFQYFLWQMLYINEINLRLKHPLACFIKIKQSIALIDLEPFEKELFVDLLQDNPLEADPVFNRDQIIRTAQEFAHARLEKFSKDLDLIQKERNILWDIVQYQSFSQ